MLEPLCESFAQIHILPPDKLCLVYLVPLCFSAATERHERTGASHQRAGSGRSSFQHDFQITAHFPSFPSLSPHRFCCFRVFSNVKVKQFARFCEMLVKSTIEPRGLVDAASEMFFIQQGNIHYGLVPDRSRLEMLFFWSQGVGFL